MPYRVTGSVVDDVSGEPRPGLLVRAYDRDLVVDDPLGETRTDAAGRFEIVFTEAQFRDFLETRPDPYVRVYDARGEHVLYTTRAEARRDSRGDEHFEIRLSRSLR
jgi:hypothetical protein